MLLIVELLRLARMRVFFSIRRTRSLLQNYRSGRGRRSVPNCLGASVRVSVPSGYQYAYSGLLGGRTLATRVCARAVRPHRLNQPNVGLRAGKAWWLRWLRPVRRSVVHSGTGCALAERACNGCGRRVTASSHERARSAAPRALRHCSRRAQRLRSLRRASSVCRTGSIAVRHAHASRDVVWLP